MTRKLLITAAIVAIALAPSIGIGTARPAALVEILAVFTAAGLVVAVFIGGTAAVFTAGMVASIRVIMVTAIPRTATTATDQG